ncbi:MAG: LacI family transcriptional regulator [Lentisphaerae bacterium]|nr:LacI family transcriptional regulator [Lentisphaerota bacterium]
MATTLKQLAAELHLSPATVSLALRNSPLIAEKTKEKVCALAEKRNYIKSNLGVALQAGKSRIIGYLIDGITNTFYNEVLQGAGDMAPQLDYGLLIGWAGSNDRINEQQIRLMLEKDVDALIVSEHNNRISKYLDRFASRRKPVVYCTVPVKLRDHFLQ